MPYDGDLTKWQQPEKRRPTGLFIYFFASFAVGVVALVVWTAFESYAFVRAPMVAMEVQKSMRLKDESGRLP